MFLPVFVNVKYTIQVFDLPATMNPKLVMKNDEYRLNYCVSMGITLPINNMEALSPRFPKL